jgi:hypothetical protein
MIRASPNTEWLMGAVALDGKGFVKTGPDLGHDDLSGWPLPRSPFLLETSVRGIRSLERSGGFCYVDEDTLDPDHRTDKGRSANSTLPS